MDNHSSSTEPVNFSYCSSWRKTLSYFLSSKRHTKCWASIRHNGINRFHSIVEFNACHWRWHSRSLEQLHFSFSKQVQPENTEWHFRIYFWNCHRHSFTLWTLDKCQKFSHWLKIVRNSLRKVSVLHAFLHWSVTLSSNSTKQGHMIRLNGNCT